METVSTAAAETSPESVVRTNKLAIIGFLTMLAGPAILILAGLLTGLFGDYPVVLAWIIAGTAMVLPGAGAVYSIISLRRWKKTGMLGRALSIVILVMCNPLFYYIYIALCGIMGSTMAGLSWM